MESDTPIREEDGTLTSESLAVLIIDALVDTGLVAQGNFDEAVNIAKIEIDARKAMNDY